MPQKTLIISLMLLAGSSLATALHTTQANASPQSAKGQEREVNTSKIDGKRTAAYVSKGSVDPLKGKFLINVEGFENGQRIPDRFAYCVPNGNGGTKDGGNVSPAISWSPPPAGTKSLAILVVDEDVPASFDKANRPGEVIPQAAPRQNFYHWVVLDIPPSVNGILEGKDSRGVIPGGKPYGKSDYGLLGQNDYVKVSQGKHGGYDGPCPPWNDERLHHYHFKIFALDVATLNLPSPVNGTQLDIAMRGHVLAEAEHVGIFTNHPALLAKK